jgi:hypothetical protein
MKSSGKRPVQKKEVTKTYWDQDWQMPVALPDKW